MPVADIAQNLRIAYDGEVVTSVRCGEEDVGFRVMLEERAHRRLNYLSELLVPNQHGELVKLKTVVGFETGPGSSKYHHYDGERTITITADVDQEIATSLEVTRKVLDQLNFDKTGTSRNLPGMRVVIGGESEETQESMLSLYTQKR
mgnify:CR=1 FL=1